VANEGDDRRPTLARGNRLVVGLPRPVLLPRLTAAAERCSSGLRVVRLPIERDRHKSFYKMQFNRTAHPRRSAMTMNRFRLLGLALGLALVALSLVPLPAHAVSCGRDSYDDLWTFYSNATYTTVVGQFENDCGACTHWGIQTAYYTVVTSRLC
jgi:hypothetical protein